MVDPALQTLTLPSQPGVFAPHFGAHAFAHAVHTSHGAFPSLCLRHPPSWPPSSQKSGTVLNVCISLHA